MAAKKTRRRKRRTKRTGKSISLGNGFKLNISKSGVNLSGGIKGARMSIGNKGIKSTLSIPGTGISKTKTLVSTKDIFDKKSKEEKEKKSKEVKEIIDNKKVKESKIDINHEQKDRPQVESLEGRQVQQQLKPRVMEGLPKGSKPELRLTKETSKLPVYIGVLGLGMLLFLINKYLGGGLAIMGAILIILDFQLPKNRAKKYYNKGVEFYKAGKIKEAITEMEKAALFHPKGRNIQLALGKINLYDLKDYEQARSCFENLYVYSKDQEVLLELANCYEVQEEYDEIYELLSQTQLSGKYKKKGTALLAKSCLVLSKTKEAIELLLPFSSEVVLHKEESIDIYYLLGMAYLDELDYAKASQYLEKVKEIDSEYEDLERLLDRLR